MYVINHTFFVSSANYVIIILKKGRWHTIDVIWWALGRWCKPVNIPFCIWNQLKTICDVVCSCFTVRVQYPPSHTVNFCGVLQAMLYCSIVLLFFTVVSFELTNLPKDNQFCRWSCLRPADQ